VTVVPLAFQLTGWIPAWWGARAGGDDLLDLVGPDVVAQLTALRATTTAISAYCPALGVSALPGPRNTTEAAVAAGQAVVLHAGLGPSTLLIPDADDWWVVTADPARPVDLDLRQAASEMAEAVLVAEEQVRAVAGDLAAERLPAGVRPLPPGADPQRRGLLVRAVRLWTAVAAVPAERRTPALQGVERTSARAALAAYAEPVPADGGRIQSRHRRTV
jgi:hypothetical protein